MPTLTPITPRPRGRIAAQAARALTSLAERIDRNPALSFALLSGFYFVAVFCLSSVKLLWLDELITLHIARLDSARAIWNALASGADPNPPLIHLLVMESRRLFGEHAWALRLPAALGYWVGMWALFLFLRQRVAASWALAGVVFSMGMGGFEWSFESRSYALFYGLAMLALYCWTRTVEEPSPARRYAATAGLALSLAGGICANYFAVLAFLPIAAAELTRTILESRRSSPLTSFFRSIRWSIWIALGVAISPMLAFRPAIKRSVDLYADYAFNRVSVYAAVAGYTGMVEWMIYPLFGLMLLALAVHLLRCVDPISQSQLRPRWLAHLASSPKQPYPLLKPPEAAAICVLVAYPFLGFFMAVLRGGMLSPRFVIPVCLGCSIAGLLFTFRTFGHLRAAGTITLTIALCWFTLRAAYSGWVYEVRKQSFYRLLAHIPPPEFPNQPLAISDDLMVLPIEFYASPEVVARIVYPIDFPAIMRDRGEASPEVNFWYSRSTVYKFPIVPLATLQKNTSTYIILTSGREWLVADLRSHWYDVEPMLIDTQNADTYDFFSPLTHARPVFFRATGDLFPTPYNQPLRFNSADNVPQANPK